MTVETSLDRLTMLSDFGIDIVLPNSKVIKGIFDNPHLDVNAGGSVPFSIQEARVTVRTSDTSSLAQGSIVEIDNDHYVITDIQPDGTGITELVLEAQ